MKNSFKHNSYMLEISKKVKCKESLAGDKTAQGIAKDVVIS